MERTRTRPRADRRFRALADPTRLRILRILRMFREGECCVSDIIAILQVPQAKASHHLNYLQRAGLVAARQQGLWCFYRLAPARSLFHRGLLACLEHCFDEVPNAAGDRLRAARLREEGGCCPSMACGVTGTTRPRRNRARPTPPRTASHTKEPKTP